MPLEITNYSNLYDQVFPSNPQTPSAGLLKLLDVDGMVGPLEGRPVDYSISYLRTWGDVAKDIAILVLTIVFFPITLPRYIIQRTIMMILYPAQNTLFRKLEKGFSDQNLDNLRKNLLKQKDDDTLIRHVVLEKDGVRYSGLMIGKGDTLLNGKWVLQATANCEPIEFGCLEYHKIYASQGTNLLLVNGPGVGRSKGTANPSTMGDAQEVGIQFLEHAVKAKKIALAGFSLGMAAIGQAILKHNFLPEIEYAVVSQMAFDRTSNISAKVTHLPLFIAKAIIWFAGLEMDNVEASKKLSDLKIKHIVIQSTKHIVGQNVSAEDVGSDGVIPADASLAYSLLKEKVTTNKLFWGIKNCSHNDVSKVVRGNLNLLNLLP